MHTCLTLQTRRERDQSYLRYRYFVEFRYFPIFFYGIAVSGTPQCPPQHAADQNTQNLSRTGNSVFFMINNTFGCLNGRNMLRKAMAAMELLKMAQGFVSVYISRSLC